MQEYYNNEENLNKLFEFYENEKEQESTNRYSYAMLVAESGLGKTRFCIEAKKRSINNFYEKGVLTSLISYNNKAKITKYDEADDDGSEYLEIAFLSKVFFDIIMKNAFDLDKEYIESFQEIFFYLKRNNKYIISMNDIYKFCEAKYKCKQISVLIDELIQFKVKTGDIKFQKISIFMKRLPSNKIHIFFTSLQL